MKLYLGDANQNVELLMGMKNFTDFKTGVAVVKAAERLGFLHDARRGLITSADAHDFYDRLHGLVIYEDCMFSPAYKIPVPKDVLPDNIEYIYVSGMVTDHNRPRQWVSAKYKNQRLIKNWCVLYDGFSRYGYESDASFEGHEI